MPKAPFTTACLVATLCVLPAQAADTPSNMPEPQAATVADPLRPARDVIGARQWDQALSLLLAQQTLQRLCGGTTCEEYQDLAKALAAYRD